MRKIGKLLCAVLAVCISFAVTACDTQETSEKIDKTKTQLYVQSFEGGFGSEWLYDAKARFEAQFRDQSFEEGKRGVQIMITPAKQDGYDLRSVLNASNSEVFFNETVFYYDYLADELLLDITDVVTGDLSEFGDSDTIEDKMTAEQVDYYNVNGKYYGIPHYAGFQGIVYDVDVFEDYLLYFKDTNGGASTFVAREDDVRSTGPDGKLGTADDGLPATFDEFFMLCDYMVDLGVTPFVWTGQHFNTYIEKTMYALCVDHEGLEQTMLNYTFRGKATNLINPVSSDGTYTFRSGDGIDITPQNAYLLWTSEGKYLSMSFFERIVKNGDYYGNLVFSPSHMHLDAQKDFLESTPKGKPIAMILEGDWWENEAKDSMKMVADYYGQQYARENRRFGMMPFPKASKEKVGEKSTLVDTQYSLGFIKKTIADYKIDLAKKFLKFCNTEESLNAFTVCTNSPKALNYKMTDENYQKLTYFGKSIYDLHQTSDIVYPYSSEKVYLDNQSMFFVMQTFGSTVDGQDELRPITYLRSRQSNNSEDYFNGMLTYNLNRWDRVFGGYT